MNTKEIQNGNITHKRVKIVMRDGTNGVQRWREAVPDGLESVTYVATVNLTDLEAMAHQAAYNKSGVCRDGALVVKVVSRVRL